jgi:hypothetical protein
MYPEGETPIDLAEAARLIYPGRTVPFTTVHRWVRVGVLGVKLEAWRRGYRWVTTREAVERFRAAVAATEPCHA